MLIRKNFLNTFRHLGIRYILWRIWIRIVCVEKHETSQILFPFSSWSLMNNYRASSNETWYMRVMLSDE